MGDGGVNAPKILYVCSQCHEHAAEACGWPDRHELVVGPDGQQLCDACYDRYAEIYDITVDPEFEIDDTPLWSELPHPPDYLAIHQKALDVISAFDVRCEASLIDALRHLRDVLS